MGRMIGEEARCGQGTFGQSDRMPSMAGEPGRNQPCPCASGRKHEQCHLGRWSDTREPGDLLSQVHEASLRLPSAILHFAVASYGPGVVDLAWRMFSGSNSSPEAALISVLNW